MEQVKKTRKQNRSKDEIRDSVNAKVAYHHLQINQLNARLADLDKPREARKRSPGMNKALAEARAAGITPEQILQFVAAQKGGNTSL